jgi:hypothetical protein
MANRQIEGPLMRKLVLIIFAVFTSGVMLGVSFGVGTSHAAPGEPTVTVSGSERIVERRLDRWKPTKENDWAPSPAIQRPQTDIAGTWQVSRGLDGSSLVITRSGPGSYDITLQTAGCLGSWTLRRTGRYSAGVLVLNRPVQEYLPITYQKLYAVRIGSAECLVPNISLHSANGFKADGTLFAFRRMPNRPAGAGEGGQIAGQ